MYEVEIATYALAIVLFILFCWWFSLSGYVYVKNAMATIIRFKEWVMFEFDNPFARQVTFFVKTLGKSEPLMWFMLGITVEALGLGVQAMFAMDTYPLLDFLVSGIVVTILYVYQNWGKKNAQCV